MSNPLPHLDRERAGRRTVRDQVAVNRRVVAFAEQVSHYGDVQHGWERRGLLQTLSRRQGVRRVA